MPLMNTLKQIKSIKFCFKINNMCVCVHVCMCVCVCAHARFSVIFSFLKFILFIPMLLFRHCHFICYSASITDTIRCILFYSTVPSLSLYSSIAIPSLSLYLRFRCSAIFILFQCCFSVTDPLCCIPLFRHCHSISVLLFRH